MKKFLAMFCFVVVAGISYNVQAAGEFILTINTDPDTVGDDTMLIPTHVGSVYDYTVDWGDGNIESNISGDANHTYAVAGTYQIQITGTFPRIYFNSSASAAKVVSIDQWGNNQWSSMERAFDGVTDLTVAATDIPDLSAVTDMSYIFSNITTFNDTGGSIPTWNISNVENLESSFANGDFNEPIGNWNTINVTNMNSTFSTNTGFNQPLLWNTSNVTNMGQMFSGASVFNQNIGNWNTSNVTDMSQMFSTATAFNQDLSWNTGAVTNMSYMFSGASNFNGTISGFNTSQVTDMTFMFNEASAFNKNISTWNTSNVTNMSYMFANNTGYNQSLSSWDTSSVTNMQSMFSGASSFDQNLGSWDVSQVSNFSDFAQGANISYTNYDAILDGWASQNVQSGISIAFDNGLFCNAASSRSFLILTKGWSIIDSGSPIGCPVPYVTNVTSPNADSSYTTGQSIDIELIFNEVVDVIGGVPAIQLETGVTDASALYVSGSGTNTLLFRYTVAGGHTSSDLQYVNTSALTNGQFIRDHVGTSLPAISTLPALNAGNSLAGNKNLIVSGITPSISVQSNSTGGWSSPASITYSGSVEKVVGGSCSLFSLELKSGQKSNQVVDIKKFLNKNLETKLNTNTVFDEATRKAVIRFQEKYRKDILNPARLKKGTGMWYSATIKKANELVCGR